METLTLPASSNLIDCLSKDLSNENGSLIVILGSMGFLIIPVAKVIMA